MMVNQSIEMILDLNCSWCPIGYSYLMRALNNTKLNSFVDVSFIPFQLNPAMGKEGELINQHLTKMTGQSENELIQYREKLLKVAHAAGVKIDFSKRTHYYNTLTGHMLLQLSQEQNLQHEIYRVLCHGYYEKGLQFDDSVVLAKVADVLGLSLTEMNHLLLDNKLKSETLKRENKAKELNIKSVPSFLVNGEKVIAGSNSVSFFENLLTEMQLSKSQQRPVLLQ